MIEAQLTSNIIDVDWVDVLRKLWLLLPTLRLSLEGNSPSTLIRRMKAICQQQEQFPIISVERQKSIFSMLLFFCKWIFNHSRISPHLHPCVAFVCRHSIEMHDFKKSHFNLKNDANHHRWDTQYASQFIMMSFCFLRLRSMRQIDCGSSVSQRLHWTIDDFQISNARVRSQFIIAVITAQFVACYFTRTVKCCGRVHLIIAHPTDGSVFIISVFFAKIIQ